MFESWKEICKYPGRLKLLDASSRTPCPASCCSTKIGPIHTPDSALPLSSHEDAKAALYQPEPPPSSAITSQDEREAWGLPDSRLPRPSKWNRAPDLGNNQACPRSSFLPLDEHGSAQLTPSPASTVRLHQPAASVPPELPQQAGYRAIHASGRWGS